MAETTLNSGAGGLLRATSPNKDADRAEGDPNLRFLMQYDPIPTARKIRVPVLILQGETNRQVTREQADTLANAIRSDGNPDVTVYHFPNVNHLFLQNAGGWSAGYRSPASKKISREVLGVIADWLESRLQAGAT